MDEILNLIGSVSEDFPSYSLRYELVKVVIITVFFFGKDKNLHKMLKI